MIVFVFLIKIQNILSKLNENTKNNNLFRIFNENTKNIKQMFTF